MKKSIAGESQTNDMAIRFGEFLPMDLIAWNSFGWWKTISPVFSISQAFTTGSKVREGMVDAFLTNEFVSGCASQPKVDAFVAYDNSRENGNGQK